ncbi:MAG: helix-hairpin-helix domain-containing protein [Bacteroidetes bacterium]|nr:helix-hairpin-helix domain-containing protein [Bacteroidota bacterium]
MIENLPLKERKLDSAEQNSGYARKVMGADPTKPLFSFDPNTVTFSQLKDLGFGEKRAAILLKFRAKGFVFKEQEDLKKVYGINEDFYQTLKPYITIENVASKDAVVEKKPIIKAAKIIELNSADSLTLLEINGIGPSFAKRILKYKILLGGFVRADQLKEVYGFTEEMYDHIISQITVNASLIKKLNINTDDFKTINKHPYLSFELTKLIFNAKRKEPLTAEVLKSLLNDEILYSKLLPYINF